MGRTQLLLLMVGASTVNYVGRSAMSIAGPEIAKQYHFSEAQLGEIFSAFWLGYALMMLPSGWLTDRFSPGRVLGICGLISAALLAGTAGVTALGAFLALRFVFGVASAALYPACGSLTVRWFEAKSHAGVQGLVVGGSNFGGALAPMLVVWLISAGGWPGSFIAVGGLTAIFFAVWLMFVKDAPSEAGQTPPAARLQLNRPMLFLAAQSFCIGYFYNFGDTWSYYYFKEVRHLPEEQSALFTTLVQIAGGIMMPLGGWLADLIAPRFGRIVPAFAALALSGILLAISVRMENPMLMLGFITASYSLVVACEGVYWWAVLAHGASSPGSAYGFANAVGNVAQFLAPLSFPWLAARWGWEASVYSAALALFVSAFLWKQVPETA